jgi:hypothetical protein
MSATATIGHNLPRDREILDRLGADYEEIHRRADDLVQAAERVPDEIGDDVTHARAVDFIARQVRPHIQRVEEIHKAEKRPHLDAGRAVDIWRNALVGDLEEALQSVRAKVEAYERLKGGGTTRTSTGSLSRLRSEIGFKVVDPVEAGRAFAHLIDSEALAKAIRRHIREEGAGFRKGLEGHGKPMLVCGVQFFIEQRSMIR